MSLLDNLYNCWQFNDSLAGVNGKPFSISHPQFEVGKFDIGLRCNGNTDSAGAASDTTDFLTSGAWTGAFWVKMVALPTSGVVILSDNRAGSGGGYWITCEPGGIVKCNIKSGAPFGKFVTSTVALAAGNWALVIFGYDPATLKSFIRINDVQTTLASTFTAFGGAVSPLTIGMVYLLNGGVPNAVFDTFSLWTRTLTEVEMQALWNGGAGLDYPFA